MDSSIVTECGICGQEADRYHRNLMKLKTKFSSTPVFELLERFLERELSDQSSEFEKSGCCGDCLVKFNDYDAAHTKAIIIQQELTDLLEKGTLCILNAKHQQNAEQNEENETECKEDVISWTPYVHEKGEAKLSDIKTSSMSFEDLSTVKVSMKCNLCEAIFNNIKEMRQHSHKKSKKFPLRSQTQPEQLRVATSNLFIEPVKNYVPSADEDVSHIDVSEHCVESLDESYHNGEEEEWVDKYIAPKADEKVLEEKSVTLSECFYCEESFGDRVLFKEHLHKKHTVHPTVHRCKICGFVAKTRAALASHFGKHTRESQLKCQYCNKSFIHKSAMLRHIAMHTGEKAYQCHLCGKQYVHYSSYYMHQLAHKNIRAKKCELCGYSLRSTSHLKRHMRTHSGERPFSCPECGQTFSQRYNMVQHLKVHQGVVRRVMRSYQCTECDQVFKQKIVLVKHLTEKHGLPVL